MSVLCMRMALFFIPVELALAVVDVCFNSVSFMFFWRPKELKAPAHGTHQSVVALFKSSLWLHFSVAANLAVQAYRMFFGCAKLVQLAAQSASN